LPAEKSDLQAVGDVEKFVVKFNVACVLGPGVFLRFEQFTPTDN